MIIQVNSTVPIYMQIANGIETDILNGVLVEEEHAYSQYQISKQYRINPATAAKGINLLVAEGILIKKRGLGMYVAKGAMKMITKKRKKQFLTKTVPDFIGEAQKLGLTKEELKKIIMDYKEN